MRAIQQRAWGGPEVLELVELPIPRARDGELLIKVDHAGLNFADTHARENSYIAKYELPFIPGSEVAGVRQDTGERVVALCGTGGYAEYVTAPADRVFAIPKGVDDGTALALLLQGLTAWHLYATCGRVQPGETVVVIGGAGGTGSLACQLGQAFGARVIATASTPEKRELCLRLGADAAIDGDDDLLSDRIVEANGGEPVDVVFEMSGGPVFDQAITTLAPFGRMVVYGISSRVQNDLRTGRLLKSSHSIIGFWLMHCLDRPAMIDDALRHLFELAAKKQLEAVVGATYPLADAAQAQIDLVERRTTGKVLLSTATDDA